MAIADGRIQDAHVGVGRTVEPSLESQPETLAHSHSGLVLRVLGPVRVSRDGKPVALPRSRKVRALLAYLALESRSQSRSRLCGLLWNVPNDPRGELRWCLSKLRGVLDDSERRRVLSTDTDSIALDLSDCHVDALEVDRSAKAGIEQATGERLRMLCALFGGELLEGLEVDGTPEFSGWLSAQRHRYRVIHTNLLGEVVTRATAGDDETFRHLGDWLRLAPFDLRAHRLMLDALVRSGRMQDAEHHVASAMRSFEREGMDWAPLRDAWQVTRSARVVSAPVQAATGAATASIGTAASTLEPRARRRRSIAVLPFVETTSEERAGRGKMADGLTEDIITRLAKLRVLFVIARGTVYALGERGIAAEEAGRLLNVEYIASGAVRREANRLSVSVELVDTEDSRIVWTDELHGAVDQTFSVLDSIVDRIVAAMAEGIEAAECNRAILRPPSSLDAWEAYHRGLWHMYRFNGPDNAQAEQFFRSALKLDPTFSRAYAGLSFTHFQNTFLHLTSDHERQIEHALETAGRSIGADDRDPAAHWAMGRALWLHRRQDEALAELQRSIELSPNFALGHYTLGFVQSQAGDPRAAIQATDYSRELSPFDPLQFGMLASRALAHVRLGELDEAADWAVKAARRPNAHTHILAIAAQCLGLAGRRDEAQKLVGRIRELEPNYNVEDFLRAFRFGRDTESLFRHGARQLQFDSPASSRPARLP